MSQYQPSQSTACALPGIRVEGEEEEGTLGQRAGGLVYHWINVRQRTRAMGQTAVLEAQSADPLQAGVPIFLPSVLIRVGMARQLVRAFLPRPPVGVMGTVQVSLTRHDTSDPRLRFTTTGRYESESGNIWQP